MRARKSPYVAALASPLASAAERPSFAGVSFLGSVRLVMNVKTATARNAPRHNLRDNQRSRHGCAKDCQIPQHRSLSRFICRAVYFRF